MAVPILIATPYPVFAELLRISLEENGDYQVRQVQSGEQAVAAITRIPFAIAFLDSYMIDQSVVVLAGKLRSIQSDVRIIVIPPDNNPDHPSLVGLNADTYITRPFYLPDLLQTVSNLIKEIHHPAQEVSQLSEQVKRFPDHPWLSDAQESSTRLMRLVANMSIEAALIIYQGQIIAQAGAESVSFSNVAEIVARYWKPEEKSDLARYIRPNSGQVDSLLYATVLTDSVVLALVFPASVPLTRARSQTVKIARKLIESPIPTTQTLETQSPADLQELKPRSIVEEFRSDKEVIKTPEELTSDTDSEGEAILEEAEFPGDLSAVIPGFSGDEVEIPEGEDESIDLDRIQLEEFLSDLPSPNPDAVETTKKETNRAEQSPDATKPNVIPGFLMPWEEEPNGGESKNTNQEEPDSVVLIQMDPDSESTGQESEDTAYSIIQSPKDPLADTRPMVIQPLAKIKDLEPTSPALSHLYFTCLLIPRLPHHYLTGELADQLAQWLPHICVAFGWRLEGLSVRPEYMQWIVQVSPSMSPGNLIRIIRQRSSMHIFQAYPTLGYENPSGDFWAPGYLIISGAQPPASQLVREFIIQTRTRQGIQRP